MDQVMNINDWYLFQGVCNIIAFQRIIGPRLLGLKTDEAAIEAAMPRARTVVAELARLLGEQPYFAGDAVSLADLLVAPQIDFMAPPPEWSELGVINVNLAAWLTRMQARPSFVATSWERVSEMAKAA
jgi:glutathione S-transferase